MINNKTMDGRKSMAPALNTQILTKKQ